MTDIAALKRANAARWAAMKLDTRRIDSFDKVAHRLVGNKIRYQFIEKATNVPWWVIAVIHEREASGNFSSQLSQGDPLDRVSVNEPAGRGPFLNHPTDFPGQDAFYRGAIDALVDCSPHASKWGDWSTGGALTLLEAYNGYGYATKGKPSPYVWSGTDQYISGKYVRDGVYDPDVRDVQNGCAPLIARMRVLDSSIKFADEAGQKPQPPKPPVTPTKEPAQPRLLITLIDFLVNLFKRK